MSTKPAELIDTREQPGPLMRFPWWVLAGLASVLVVVVAWAQASPRPVQQADPAIAPPLQPRQPPMPVPEQRLPYVPPVAPRPETVPQVQPSVDAYKQPDPITEQRKQRDYDSLFASNVVTKRPQPQAATQAPPAPTPATEPKAAPTEQQPGLVLTEGTVIEAVLTNRLEGSSDGPVNAMVTSDVYIGRTKVIPKGSRILGKASRVQDQNSERLAVAFHRVLLTDGTSISLDKEIPGLDQQGAQGLADQVNRHYWSTFGAAAAVGVLSGFGQWLGGGYGGYGDRDGTVIVTGTTDAVSQATSQTLSHFLNRLPTITIREGHRIRVYLTSDITIPER